MNGRVVAEVRLSRYAVLFAKKTTEKSVKKKFFGKFFLLFQTIITFDKCKKYT